MLHVKWIGIIIVILLSLTFLFPAQKAEVQNDEEAKTIIKKACKDNYATDLSGFEKLRNLKIHLNKSDCWEAKEELKEELRSLEELKNLKISIDLDELYESIENSDCLDEIMNINCYLEGLEALESLESLKCLEALKALERLEIDIDWDEFDFDFDDFAFDWDFDFDFDELEYDDDDLDENSEEDGDRKKTGSKR